jgi:hypothetical protein
MDSGKEQTVLQKVPPLVLGRECRDFPRALPKLDGVAVDQKKRPLFSRLIVNTEKVDAMQDMSIPTHEVGAVF